MRPNPASSVLYRTLRILEGANIYALLSVLILAGLFVLGNYQQFLDDSLLLLLRMLSAFSLLCIASGLGYLISLLVWSIRRRRLMPLRVLYGVLATSIGAAAAAATGLLQSLVLPT